MAQSQSVSEVMIRRYLLDLAQRAGVQLDAETARVIEALSTPQGMSLLMQAVSDVAAEAKRTQQEAHGA